MILAVIYNFKWFVFKLQISFKASQTRIQDGGLSHCTFRKIKVALNHSVIITKTILTRIFSEKCKWGMQVPEFVNPIFTHQYSPYLGVTGQYCHSSVLFSNTYFITTFPLMSLLQLFEVKELYPQKINQLCELNQAHHESFLAKMIREVQSRFFCAREMYRSINDIKENE